MEKRSITAGVRIFIVISVFVGLAMGLSDSIIANYFKEAYNVTSEQRGFIEFPRELPGIISIFFIAALSFLKNVKTAIVTQILSVVGLLVLGIWKPSFSVMLIFLFIYSLGVHMYMPLNDSIGLSLAKNQGIGKTMGLFNGFRMGSLMLAGVISFFGFRYGVFNFDTPILVFLISAVAFAIIGALLFALRKIEPSVDRDAALNAKFVFRKQYIRYYIICALFGGRKQIMLVYSPWVLIELLDFKADTMSILAVIGSLIGIFFMPMVGKWIDRFGVRNVMMIEALAFIAVYIAYGVLSKVIIMNAVALTGIVMLLVYLLNIIDRMSAQFGMVRSIYMRSIALVPEDVTPSLSLGMSIDHVLAIAGSAVCGIIWQRMGPEYVFIFAGVMSLLNFIVARGVIIENKNGSNKAHS